jgi:hypothetical protein
MIEFMKTLIDMDTMELDHFKNDTTSVLSNIFLALNSQIYLLLNK